MTSRKVRVNNAVKEAFRARGPVCCFHEEHDSNGDLAGEPCGRAATRVLVWNDGRFSWSCDQHGKEVLNDEAKSLLVAERRVKQAAENGDIPSKGE